jgi:hypothetical protein
VRLECEWAWYETEAGVGSQRRVRMRVKWAAAEGEIERGASHGGAGNTESMGREVCELGVKRQRRRARRT